jgi:SAM-dependent methyltransferase
MQTDTINYLIELNRQFYQTFGSQFSATRQRLQPGVRRILEQVPEDANLLDLGCGNGELWRTLVDSGFHGHYTGLDFSAALLDIARGDSQSHPDKASFIQADLTVGGWQAEIPNVPVDLTFAFAVLHHLPGESTRRRILETVNRLLKPGGQLIHSEWQFLNSERLKARIQPWEKADLNEDQLDPGDYLMDWKRGGYGLRYVHHFSEKELHHLAENAGFEIVETFLSDGENGRLGLYQIWKKK